MVKTKKEEVDTLSEWAKPVSNFSFMERPKENKTYLGLSIISSFESIVVVYVGLLYELPRPIVVVNRGRRFPKHRDI
jgi:hypothetical protein